MNIPSTVRARLAAAGAALLLALRPLTAAAHGELTGAQDALQHNGVLLFLVSVVLIGAGVLVWVTFKPPESDSLAPQTDEARDAE